MRPPFSPIMCFLQTLLKILPLVIVNHLSEKEKGPNLLLKKRKDSYTGKHIQTQWQIISVSKYPRAKNLYRRQQRINCHTLKREKGLRKQITKP